ncbi:MAG: hypothetical protein ABSD20_19160 [Terriglobales bacterium]|jgi:hypothetical protein
MKIRLTLAMLFVLALGTSAYYNQAGTINKVWADGNNPPPPPCCGGDPGVSKIKTPLPKPPSGN